MKAIEPEKYPDHTQRSEAPAGQDHELKDNNFDEPLEDLKESSESYSILLGLVTIETQVTSRSLTHKERSAEHSDDLHTIVDHRP